MQDCLQKKRGEGSTWFSVTRTSDDGNDCAGFMDACKLLDRPKSLRLPSKVVGLPRDESWRLPRVSLVDPAFKLSVHPIIMNRYI